MATTPVQSVATGQIAEIDLVREALAAEYEILEELGRGGMALVYRAKDRSLEREVAIKVLPFSLAFDAEFVERFQREARTAGQLEHPNIIPIYRVGRSGRVIYFVMKFLRGGSLSNVLAERGRLTPPEIRRLLVEAGGALGYAAQRGIVHRDIKPDNIMFDEFGYSVLTDFGIAKAATGQKLTGTGMSIGTPHYMSPEQARAQTIDGRSDIYSLGVVAYQCLTGAVPYDGDDSFAIGYKHITEPLPTPTLTTPDERRLYEVIRRMLLKDPPERFQSCEELVDALQGQPIAPVGAVRPRAAMPPIAPDAVPTLASQATTPIDAASVDRRRTPTERRAEPRRVADRSAALKGSGRSTAWLWLLLAIGGGGAGMFYYYKVRGFAPVAGIAAADSARQADSLRMVDSLRRVDSLAAALPAAATDTTGQQAAAAPADSAASQTNSPDSTTPDSAPIAPVQTAEAPIVATCEPGRGYNLDHSCFDQRPKPLSPTFVPIPDGVARIPRPSVLWVQVSAEGKTLKVRASRPSNNLRFERAARELARTITWQPAKKNGLPVTGWTQWIFRPN